MKKKHIIVFGIVLIAILSSLFFVFRLNTFTIVIIFSMILIASRLLYLKLNGKLRLPNGTTLKKLLFKNPSKSASWLIENIIAPIILGWISTYIYGFVFPNPDSELLKGQTQITESQNKINAKIDNIYDILRNTDDEYVHKMLTNLFGENYKSILQNNETYENLVRKLDNKTLNEILNENINLQKRVSSILGDGFSEEFIGDINKLFNQYRYSKVNEVIDEYLSNHQYISNSFRAKLYSLKAKSFAYRNWYKEAKKEIDKALAIDNNSEELLFQYAEILKWSGQLDAALEVYMNLLFGKEKKILDGDEEVFSIMEDVIYIRTKKGQYKMALDLLLPILKERNKKVEDKPTLENTVNLITTFDQLTNVYIGLKDFDKANFFQKRVADFKSKIAGDNSVIMAETFNQKGKIYEEQGKYKLALEQFLLVKEALVKEDTLAHDLLHVYNNIGKTYHRLGDYKKAINNLVAAYVIAVSDFGQDNPQCGYILVNISNLFNDSHAYDDALGFAEMAEEIFIKNFGLNDRNLIKVYNIKGNSFIGKEDYTKGKFYIEKAIKLAVESYGYETSDVGIAYGNLGVAYSGLNKSKEAIYNYNQSIEILSRFFKKDHYYIQTFKKNLHKEQVKANKIQ